MLRLSLVLLLAVLGVVVLVSPASAQRGREVVFQQAFSVRDGQSLSVNVGSGSVRVETTERGRAEVVVEGTGTNARAEFARLRFTATLSGDRLTVRTRPQRSMRGSRASFSYVVRIPRRFNADIDTGSGSVSVGALDGTLSVDTGSGSVETGAVTGRLSIDTGSGSVRVADASAATRIDTGSGSVDVTLSRIVPLSVETGSGSVRVAVPRGADATLDLDGGTVRIDDALGFDGRRERREAQGRIGRGGERISVDTGSGSISISVR